MKFEMSRVDFPFTEEGRRVFNVEFMFPEEYDALSSSEIIDMLTLLFKDQTTMYLHERILPGKDISTKDVIQKENIDHPSYYLGKDDPYETVKVIEAWYGLEGLKYFCLCSNLKYLTRAGKKVGEDEKKDLGKAEWYLQYYNKRVKAVEDAKTR